MVASDFNTCIRHSIATALPRSKQGTRIICNEIFFATCFCPLRGPFTITIFFHRKRSRKKNFNLATSAKRNDYEHQPKANTQVEKSSREKFLDISRRRSINKNAHSKFLYKAFAKSVSQNLRGPTSWSNYQLIDQFKCASLVNKFVTKKHSLRDVTMT